MDLLFASEVLVPAVGGAEQTMLEWMEGLRMRGHAVRAVFLPEAARPGPERYWRWRAQQRAAVGERVSAAIAERRPDAVVAQLHCAPAALAAAGRAKLPGVLVLPSYEGLCKLASDSDSDCPPEGDCVLCPAPHRLVPAERAALAAGRRDHDQALAAAAALVVPSRAMAATVQAQRGREATVVGPVGPELPAPAHASFGGHVVCAAACWSSHKGAALLPALIEASRKLSAPGASNPRPVHVTEAGLTPDEQSVACAAGAVLVARTTPDQLMAGASLVLVPSQWEEPFGRIAWEALARGVPVLASDAGGLRDYVPTRLQVTDRHDPAAWTSALRRLLTEHEWIAAVQGARAAAAALLDPPPLNRLEALLASVIGGGR